MQITREELIRTYGGIFVRFDFAQPLSFVYGGESYDLTEPDALEALMLRAKADGDYRSARSPTTCWRCMKRSIRWSDTAIFR